MFFKQIRTVSPDYSGTTWQQRYDGQQGQMPLRSGDSLAQNPIINSA